LVPKKTHSALEVSFGCCIQGKNPNPDLTGRVEMSTQNWLLWEEKKRRQAIKRRAFSCLA
jgi:hypothetical protein